MLLENLVKQAFVSLENMSASGHYIFLDEVLQHLSKDVFKNDIFIFVKETGTGITPSELVNLLNVITKVEYGLSLTTYLNILQRTGKRPKRLPYFKRLFNLLKVRKEVASSTLRLYILYTKTRS